jgi:uncharacterized protein YecE (DUF72 family)
LTELVSYSNLYVGTAGWSYKDWAGTFYPERMPKGKEQLAYLAEYFDAVEVNSSFYNIPPARNAEGWLKKVSENRRFKFSVKLWQGFTHEEGYPDHQAILMFRELLGVLKSGGRLGAVLVQFPWSFRKSEDNIGRISRILNDFNDYPLTIEVRHKTWDTGDFLKFLGDTGAAFCNIDQPVIGSSISPTSYITGKIAYVRFHGRNYEKWFTSGDDPAERYNYLYTEQDLAPWVDRIREILEKKIDTYVITNNHWHGKAAHTALMIKNKLTDEKQKIPEALLRAYPDLNGICKDERQIEQSDLF